MEDPKEYPNQKPADFAAISMVGNIFSELLESLPEPFVFQGYEVSVEPDTEEASNFVYLKFINPRFQMVVRLGEVEGELVIFDTKLTDTKRGTGRPNLLENQDRLGILEYIHDILVPSVT
jgi:hypothetical protein